MTPDRIKNALVSWLDDTKPDSDITVSDAQSFDDAALPRISVGVVGAETHSPAVPGVQKIQLQVTLSAHADDTDTRTTVESWCDTVEQQLNDPALAKQVLTSVANQCEVHHWLASGGVAEWDETVLTVQWQVEAWCRRLA